jgi:hypothetical protein
LPKLPAIYGQNIPSVLGQQNVALTVMANKAIKEIIEK